MAATEKILEITHYLSGPANPRSQIARRSVDLVGGLDFHDKSGVTRVVHIHYPHRKLKGGKYGRDIEFTVVEDPAIVRLHRALTPSKFPEVSLTLSHFAIGHTHPDKIQKFPEVQILGMQLITIGGFVHAGVPLGAKLWEMRCRIVENIEEDSGATTSVPEPVDAASPPSFISRIFGIRRGSKR